MAKLETDVESLLKFAKLGEFHYRPFAKPADAGAGEVSLPKVEQEQAPRVPVAKPVDVAMIDRSKLAEAASANQSAKTSLSAKFAVLASQPSKTSSKLILKAHAFGKRALPALQNSMMADSRNKPLIGIFLRLDSENVGGKKHLYLTK